MKRLLTRCDIIIDSFLDLISVSALCGKTIELPQLIAELGHLRLHLFSSLFSHLFSCSVHQEIVCDHVMNTSKLSLNLTAAMNADS
jgi:hypothetical protein